MKETKKDESLENDKSLEDLKIVNNDDTEDSIKKKKLPAFLKNKYFWVGATVVAASGAYIAYDTISKLQATNANDVNKDDLLAGTVDYINKMKSISVTSEIDMFTKVTKGEVTTPYMLGQAVTFDVNTEDQNMIHSDGKIVWQNNGSRTSRRYERYEEIGSENTIAYDNREDLVWVLKNYENQSNIKDSLQIFDMLNTHKDDFKLTNIFKVRGKECYVLEAEVLYKDLLPYLKDMVCFPQGDEMLDTITRNGFYGFVTVYVNASTGEPERLYIDFSEVARAFADVDGKEEGWEAAISTFYFQLDFENYNAVDTIEVDLSVKENAIDEMIFWERLRNGDMTYEEMIFYMMLLGYNKTDFDYFMEKLGITGEEYDRLLTLFNFDASGNPIFPTLTKEQYDYLKKLFSTDLGYEYYFQLLGITEAEYKYYLQFFASISDYGDYTFSTTMTQSEYDYYNILMKLSNSNKKYYDQVMNFIKANYEDVYDTLTQSTFEQYLKLFSESHDYNFFKQKFNWTKEEYEYYKNIFNLIISNQAMIKSSNSGYTNEYEYYLNLISNMEDYYLYIDKYKYDQIEFQYYLSLFNCTLNYKDYKEYIASDSYDNSIYAHYKAIYDIIGNHTNQFTSFEDFYNYVASIDYETFIKEFNLNTYVSSYDDKVGEDAVADSGIHEGGTLSDKWYSYSFKYDGTVIGLPLKYSDFKSTTGFSLNDADGAKTLKNNATTNKTLYKNGSADSISVILSNTIGGPAEMDDCKITSITLSQTMSSKELSKVTLPFGVKIGDSLDSVKNAYGAPYSENISGGLTNYIYRSNGRNETMKLVFSNNKLTKVTFTYN